MTSLHIAANRGYVDVAQILIKEFQADINICHKIYGTPLHCAAREGKIKIVALLLLSKAKVKILTDKKESPITLFGINGAIIEVLVTLANSTDTTLYHDRP